MRLMAFIATLVALGLAAFAGRAFMQVWQDPLPPQIATPDRAPSDTSIAAPDRIAALRDWPALFGDVKIIEPQPPKPPAPKAEPQPPAPAGPPLASLGYRLRGVVSDGSAQWALVSHPTGEQLLRAGDPLGGGYVVRAIDAQGVWVATAKNGPRQLLAFEE